MKNILVTGGNGFIGKYLHQNWQSDSHKLIFGTTSNISNTSGSTYLSFAKSYEDILDVLAQKDIDVVIHLASVIPKSFDQADQKLFLDNTKMMMNLHDFSVQKKISKFIYLSTFGSMKNPDNYDLKDYYTLSKITGEHICSIMESQGIETASLRLTSPFGEFYHSTNVLSIFIDRALQDQTIQVHGSGSRKQNFVYAGNILNCIQKCLENKISGVYDLVGDQDISMKDLAKLIVDLTKSKSNVEHGLTKDNLENEPLVEFCLNRLKNELTYAEDFSLIDGLSKYINWRKTLIK